MQKSSKFSLFILLIAVQMLATSPSWAADEDDGYADMGTVAGDSFELTFHGLHGPGLNCYLIRDGENTRKNVAYSHCKGQSTVKESRFSSPSETDGQIISIDEDGKIVD
ncbi:MAG: hypothetical protein ACXWQO_08945 [Bdellovibrionota bacterium]